MLVVEHKVHRTLNWDGDIDWYAPAEIGEQSYVSKSKKTITELGLKKS